MEEAIRALKTTHNDELVRARTDLFIQVSKLKAEHEAQLSSQRAEIKTSLLNERESVFGKYIKDKESMLEQHYKKLSDSLAKLHEEGNATTRMIKDMALKSMEYQRPKRIKKVE